MLDNLLEFIESHKVNLEYKPTSKCWVAKIKDNITYGETASEAILNLKSSLSQLSKLHWLPIGDFSYPERDCYWLVKELRNYYKLSTPNFTWVYELYTYIESQPNNLVEHCLGQVATQREGRPQHLDIALFSQSINGDLGTILEINNELWVAYMTRRGATLEPLNRRIHIIVKSYWVLPSSKSH